MTSNGTTGWMPEPAQRGTVGLVQSCLLTLWLCIYTALHLNVPHHGERQWRAYARKSLWISTGVLAPEIVVYTALMQYISARKLTRIVNSHLQKSNQPKRRNEWTLKHSFFAQMGGLAIETDGQVDAAYIPGSARLTLTSNGVAMLARAGRLPDISIQYIEDKSTQNNLAKLLAIFQGSWFLLQAIGRLIDRLPISLLEIHTGAHVLCALLIYFLWWDKPYDVEDAMVLTGDWVRPLTAALWMFSYDSTSREKARSIGQTHTRLRPPEIEGMIHCERRSPGLTELVESPIVLGGSEPTPIELQSYPLLTDSSDGNRDIESNAAGLNMFGGNNIRGIRQTQELCLLHLGTGSVRSPDIAGLDSIKSGEILLPFGFGPNPESKSFRAFPTRGPPGRKHQTRYTRYRPISIPLDEVMIERWRLACEAFDLFPQIWTQFKCERNKSFYGSSSDWLIWEYPTDRCNVSYLNPHIPDLPWLDLVDGGSSVLPVGLLALCATMYGAIHASAWMHFFPDPLERLLWRCSSVLIASTGFWWTLYTMGKVVSKYSEKLPKRAELITLLLTLAVFFSSFLAGVYLAILYIAARLFVPIEAFYSLRDLPLGVYQNTKWVQVIHAIPHL